MPIGNKESSTNQDGQDDWFFWSEGDINIGKTKIDKGLISSSKKVDTSGITIGADNRVNSDKMYGVALTLGNDDVDVGSLGTKVDTEAYSLSLYGTVSRNDNNFLDPVKQWKTTFNCFVLL